MAPTKNKINVTISKATLAMNRNDISDALPDWRAMTEEMSAEKIRWALAKQRGMTLIEIMVVVAIISLILGGVGVMAFNRFKDAQIDTARNQCVTIAGAVLQYKVQKRGKCPKSLVDLKAAGFTSSVAKDPWGNDYEFKCPGEKSEVDVISAGPDGELGTEDDLSNAGEEATEE